MRSSSRDALTKDWRNELERISKKGHRSRLRELPEIAAEMAETVASASKGGNFVIADENLVGHELCTPMGWTIFEVAARVLPILEDAFDGSEVAFHFQTRKREDWIRSSHAQALKLNPRESRTPEEYSAMMPAKLDWDRGFETINRAVEAPVSFVDIADDMMGTSPGKYIMDYFGVPEDVRSRLVVPDRKNVSPASEKLEAMRIENNQRLDAP